MCFEDLTALDIFNKLVTKKYVFCVHRLGITRDWGKGIEEDVLSHVLCSYCYSDAIRRYLEMEGDNKIVLFKPPRKRDGQFVLRIEREVRMYGRGYSPAWSEYVISKQRDRKPSRPY